MIKKVLKRVMSIGLSTIVMASLMVGCGTTSNTKADATDPSKLEPVTLKMYLIGDKPKDFDLVYDKVNAIMKEKINATLNVNFIPWGDVNSKYQLLFQSGEDFDMIFTATGWGFYNQVATKNGFYELKEDMLKKYAPNIYEHQPQDAWEQAKINNKLYMVSCDSEDFETATFAVRGDLKKKYDIDKVENLDQLEKYMEAASKDKSIKSVIVNGGQQFLLSAYMESYELSPVRGAAKPQIVFNVNDDSGKMYCYADTPQYLEYVKKMREFAQKGYWAADSISSKAARDTDFVAGNTALMAWNLKTAAQKTLAINKEHPEWDAQVADISKGKKKIISPYVNNGIAINAISKNPERALMALDLLRYNQEIHDLTDFGVQGTHWEAVGDKQYKTLEATKDFPASNVCPWGWRSQDLTRTDVDQAPIVQETLDYWKEKDYVNNPVASFSFDDSKVKNEVAAVGNVMTQYGVPLDLGMVEDVDAGVKQYREKLTEAGFDTVFKECQTQLDAYLAAYKKK